MLDGGQIHPAVIHGGTPSLDELWHSLISGPSDYLLTLDLRGRITWINRTAPGVLPEQVLGHDLLDLVPEQDRNRWRAALDRVRSGSAVELLDAKYPTGEGLRSFECRCSPVLRGGQVISLLLHARDVTTERKARQALSDSEQRFRALVENIPDAICLFDEAGIIRYANPATRLVLDYDPAMLFGADGWRLSPSSPPTWPPRCAI